MMTGFSLESRNDAPPSQFLKSVMLLLIGVVPFSWPSLNIGNKVRGLSSPLMDGTLGHYRHFSCIHFVFPEVSE